MADKFDYYDTLSIVIPGSLLAYWLPICFPQLIKIVAAAGFPPTVDVVAFVAVAIFIGHIIQALASAIEPLLYRSWGGRPSERALNGGLGDRYLAPDAARRLRKKLEDAVDRPDATEQSLFNWAIRRANAAPNSRAQTFNGLYAYHRALVVVILAAMALLIASTQWGAAVHWPGSWVINFLTAFGLLLVLMWHRARQRALYYVREVLHVAEHVADGATSNGKSAGIAAQEV